MEKFPSVRKVKENGSMKLGGSWNLRMRLLVSTLTLKPITICDIRRCYAARPPRSRDFSPLPPRQNLRWLRRRNKRDCFTGTNLRYRPGTVMGGNHFEHDCGTSRSIGYFLEPSIVLGLFGQKLLTITLKGYDSKDPSVDTFRTTTLPLLKKFGVPSQHVDLKIESRGVPPLGGGKVVLSISPFVHDTVKMCLKVHVGKLSPHCVEVCKKIKKNLGVVFDIKPDPDRSTERVILKCVGSGLKIIQELDLFGCIN